MVSRRGMQTYESIESRKGGHKQETKRNMRKLRWKWTQKDAGPNRRKDRELEKEANSQKAEKRRKRKRNKAAALHDLMSRTERNRRKDGL